LTGCAAPRTLVRNGSRGSSPPRSFPRAEWPAKRFRRGARVRGVILQCDPIQPDNLAENDRSGRIVWTAIALRCDGGGVAWRGSVWRPANGRGAGTASLTTMKPGRLDPPVYADCDHIWDAGDATVEPLDEACRVGGLRGIGHRAVHSSVSCRSRRVMDPAPTFSRRLRGPGRLDALVAGSSKSECVRQRACVPQSLMKASRSALTTSACVVHMPCGNFS